MRYTTFDLNCPEQELLQSIVNDCRFGILHVRCRNTGSRAAVLVKLNYSQKYGLTCKMTKADIAEVMEFCNEPVSLKVCNKEKNIYLVANVTLSLENSQHIWNKENFRIVVQRFNFFRKNKFQQLIHQTAA